MWLECSDSGKFRSWKNFQHLPQSQNHPGRSVQLLVSALSLLAASNSTTPRLQQLVRCHAGSSFRRARTFHNSVDRPFGCLSPLAITDKDQWKHQRCNASLGTKDECPISHTDKCLFMYLNKQTRRLRALTCVPLVKLGKTKCARVYLVVNQPCTFLYFRSTGVVYNTYCGSSKLL